MNGKGPRTGGDLGDEHILTGPQVLKGDAHATLASVQESGIILLEEGNAHWGDEEPVLLIECIREIEGEPELLVHKELEGVDSVLIEVHLKKMEDHPIVQLRDDLNLFDTCRESAMPTKSPTAC